MCPTGVLSMYHCTSGRLRIPVGDPIPNGAVMVGDRHLRGPCDFSSIEAQLKVCF